MLRNRGSAEVPSLYGTCIVSHALAWAGYETRADSTGSARVANSGDANAGLHSQQLVWQHVHSVFGRPDRLAPGRLDQRRRDEKYCASLFLKGYS